MKTITPGDQVTYRGSLTAEHGVWTFGGECFGPDDAVPCDCDITGGIVLTRPGGRVLFHVNARSITP